MIKYYPTYKVWYRGDIDENGIWGTWELAYNYANIPPDLLGYLKEALKNDLTGGKKKDYFLSLKCLMKC